MNDLTKEKLLIAPALREPDTEAVADAWNMYQAFDRGNPAGLVARLRVEADPHQVAPRLLGHGERLYPRLKLAVDLALNQGL